MDALQISDLYHMRIEASLAPGALTLSIVSEWSDDAPELLANVAIVRRSRGRDQEREHVASVPFTFRPELEDGEWTKAGLLAFVAKARAEVGHVGRCDVVHVGRYTVIGEPPELVRDEGCAIVTIVQGC